MSELTTQEKEIKRKAEETAAYNKWYAEQVDRLRDKPLPVRTGRLNYHPVGNSNRSWY